MSEKFLVNGQPMTNEQYAELLKKAREATKEFKKTPAFTAEQEQKKKDAEAKQANYNKVKAFAKSLRLTDRQIALIGYKMYVDGKEETE